MDFGALESSALLRTCVESGDPDAWKEFIARFHNVIASTVIKACGPSAKRDPELIDDLIQEVYLKLCANSCQILREFVPRHTEAIFGFLKAVSYSVVRDHFRKATSDKRGGGRIAASLNEVTALSGKAHIEMEKDVLISEIRERLQDFNERDRCVFWLHFKHGMTARAISEIKAVGLTAKGVDSTIRRLRLQLVEFLAERRDQIMKRKSKGNPVVEHGQ